MFDFLDNSDETVKTFYRPLIANDPETLENVARSVTNSALVATVLFFLLVAIASI